MEETRSNHPLKLSNPLDRANPISKLFFCWLIPYFAKGYNRELTEDDMYMYRMKHDSGTLGTKLENAWKKHMENNKNPSYIKVLVGTFFIEILFLNILIFTSEAARMVQPILISNLLLVYEDSSNGGINDIYYYSALMIFFQIINVFLKHQFNLAMMQIGMKMRIASCSLIYRKSLKLSKSALAETTIGQMVNLLSNDVGRFDQGFHQIYYLYMAPLQTLIVMVLLYFRVGLASLSGAYFLLMSISLQIWLGKKTSQFRLSTAGKTDERVRLMNEIISGIQVIKMYTWEYPFAKLVELVRMQEMKFIRLTSRVRAILMSMALSLNRCAIAISIITYALTGNCVTASYAYTVSSFYNILLSLTMFFPQAISQGSEMFISIKRIQTFLMFNETELDKESTLNSSLVLFGKEPSFKTILEPPLKGPDTNIRIKNASAKWLKSIPDNCLENVSLEIKACDLAVVVGPVGSGKSTLLHIIMQELELQSGTVHINGVISYASQDPWLFGGSVRQNILFGQQYEQNKYEEVVRVCALERDFTLFPHGDKTLVGERGVSLSGGQRSRINLARAVYKTADIYLLDDPLSAVDTNVGKQLFEECICSYLSKKCVILVTHQLQYLNKIEKMFLMKNGRIVMSGTYSDLKDSKTQYSKVFTNMEEEEEEVTKTSRITNNMETSEEKEIQVLPREEKSTGNISAHVFLSYARAGGNIIKVFLLLFAFSLSQALDSSCEYFVNFWVNIQQWKSQTTSLNDSSVHSFSFVEKPLSTNMNLTMTVQQTENLDPFDWLMPVFSSDYVPYFYAALVVMVVVVTIIRSLSFYQWCLTASTRMHNKMFFNIVYSPMRFFTLNPSGRILNRFSKDIGALDEVLPMTLLDTIQIGLTVAAISLVIGSLTVWIMIPTIVTAIIFYFMRVIYLETSRDVKRIESITRSPIYTHLTASLTGLTTIRAFKAQEILKNEFDKYQNLHSAAFFMYLGATRTFGFWLDFICVIYIALVIAFMLFLKNEQFGGNMGLALTQAMGLTGMFQWGMRQWSELENQMTSVERVQEYADLKQEDDKQTIEPSPGWPDKGEIEFNHLCLQYSPLEPYVLKNLSFIIKPNEKIGIVGRTGAGKSSLIQALFRLADISGSIFVDGVDTQTISLKTLRSKISIIPQEPVLFSGTLRKNLDPFDEYEDEVEDLFKIGGRLYYEMLEKIMSDELAVQYSRLGRRTKSRFNELEILWNALEEVELKYALDDLSAGLDSKMAERGSNLSTGQRQLVCLARAIVRNNKILVLDEATANVDPHTDALIQTTIRKKFASCTVLTIAHRLNTIMDCDKVLVMDAGEAVEFDHPYTLLKNYMGVFYSLVQQTGKATAKKLMNIAENNYDKKQD